MNLVDGRQSPTAIKVQRGTMRLLFHMGYSPLPEFALKTGRRVDIAGVNDKGHIIIAEIKSSLEDFRNDSKWQEYAPFADQFYFAVAEDFPLDILPADQGLIVADQFGGEIIREADEHPLAPARRKAMTLLFARKSAGRLLHLHDPDFSQ